MSLLVLALLVGLWAAILLPGAVRAHRASSPASTVDAFRRTMERLSTRPVSGPEPMSHADAATPPADPRIRAQARRRTVVTLLVAWLVAAAAGAVWISEGFLWLVLTDAVALAAYVGLLFGLRARADEARRKVLPLPSRPPSPSPPPPTSTGAVALPSAAVEQG